MNAVQQTYGHHATPPNAFAALHMAALSEQKYYSFQGKLMQKCLVTKELSRVLSSEG